MAPISKSYRFISSRFTSFAFFFFSFFFFFFFFELFRKLAPFSTRRSRSLVFLAHLCALPARSSRSSFYLFIYLFIYFSLYLIHFTIICSVSCCNGRCQHLHSICRDALRLPGRSLNYWHWFQDSWPCLVILKRRTGAWSKAVVSNGPVQWCQRA